MVSHNLLHKTRNNGVVVYGETLQTHTCQWVFGVGIYGWIKSHEDSTTPERNMFE